VLHVVTQITEAKRSSLLLEKLKGFVTLDPNDGTRYKVYTCTGEKIIHYENLK
jgi:hypothetical protein